MRISDWSSDVCSSDLEREAKPLLLAHENLPDRAARGDADEAMAFQVGEFEARRRGRHILFAVEHHQFTLAEPAASDRSVPRHLDRDRDAGLALVQLAHQDRKSTRLNSSH